MVELKPEASDETSAAVASVLEVQGRKVEMPARIPTSSEVRAAKAMKLHESIESPVLIVGRLVRPDLATAATKEEEAWQGQEPASMHRPASAPSASPAAWPT